MWFGIKCRNFACGGRTRCILRTTYIPTSGKPFLKQKRENTHDQSQRIPTTKVRKAHASPLLRCTSPEVHIQTSGPPSVFLIGIVIIPPTPSSALPTPSTPSSPSSTTPASSTTAFVRRRWPDNPRRWSGRTKYIQALNECVQRYLESSVI